jgi:arylsulfatase A-like enzyme
MKACALIFACLALSVQGAVSRPNILFIMTDDHAAHAIGAYSSKINKTPHLDRLAREGMLFTNCFVANSICTPSRATLLTGKYSHLNGTPVFNRFDGSQQTAPKLLQQAGYFTGMIGKWHLGSDPTGFDHWNILPGQGRYNDPIFYDKTGSRVLPGYVTDVITDLTIQLLENRPKDKPFFIMAHHKAPHREWTPSAKYRAEFRNRAIPEPETLWDDYATRTDAIREQQQSVFNDFTRGDLKLTPPPDLSGAERNAWLAVKPTEVELEQNGERTVLKGIELQKWKYQRYMQDYLGCVQSVDDSVGRLVDWLDAHGLRENTLVIYTSDQGFFLGDHGMYDKRFMYEHSLRAPLLVRWPGVIKAGGHNTDIVINTDFAPTFLDIAEAQIPSDMQGRSLVSLLRGQTPPDWRASMYYRYYHDPGHHNTRQHYGVRTHTHKLIYFWTKDQWELFDLVKDPHELNNLYGKPGSEQITAQLKSELTRLKRELKDDDQFASSQPPPGVDGPPPARAPRPTLN